MPKMWSSTIHSVYDFCLNIDETLICTAERLQKKKNVGSLIKYIFFIVVMTTGVGRLGQPYSTCGSRATCHTQSFFVIQKIT